MRLWNKKLAASALATISATSGTTIAFAESPTPTLSASQLDQIIIVTGQGFAHSTQITVDAKVDGGSGSGTVPSTANGTLKLGFELTPGFAGHVQLTAKTSESAALATTSIVAKSNTPTPSTTQPQPAQTTTTAPAPTTAPKTTVAPTVKITYGPLFPANVMSADNDLRKDISKSAAGPEQCRCRCNAQQPDRQPVGWHCRVQRQRVQRCDLHSWTRNQAHRLEVRQLPEQKHSSVAALRPRIRRALQECSNA